jgi:hypothetical protein
VANEHISLIVGVVVGVCLVAVIVCVTIFLCKKCSRSTRQTSGPVNRPSGDDNPGPDPHYDEGMQQRMDEWAAIRRRRPAKPFDKPGNHPEAAFGRPGKIFLIYTMNHLISGIEIKCLLEVCLLNIILVKMG